MLQNLLPKMPKRKKPEEADKGSLLNRAFSGKPQAATQIATIRKPVATYRDPYAKLRRTALRVMLTLILPIIGLAVIAFVTFNTVSSNIQEAPVNVETITMGNVPLPAGLRKIGVSNPINTSNYIKNQSETFLPRYFVKVQKIERYSAPMTPIAIIQYYRAKLLDDKQLKWQQQRQLGLSTSLDTLYVRALGNGEIEGVMLQILVGEKDSLKKGVNQDGTTDFVVAKVVASPGR